MSTINGGTLLTQAGTMASYTNRNKQLAVLATILAQANAGTPVSSTATQEDILATEIGLDQLSSQQLLGIVINQFQNLNDGTIPLPTTFNSLVTFNAGIVVNGTSALNGTVTVTGNETVSGTLGVTGATTLTGLLTANGGVTTTSVVASTTLAVTGAATLSGAVAVNNTLTTRGETINQPDGTATNPYSLLNGNWAGATFPVAYFQRVSNGGVALDVMGKGAGRNTTWIDICPTDISLDSSNWDCLHVGADNTDASITYYQVGVNKLGTGTIKPLIFQRNLAQGTAGTYLGIGGFGTGDLPIVAIQARFQTDANLGWDSANATTTGSVLTCRFQAFNNAGTNIPLQIVHSGKPLLLFGANNTQLLLNTSGGTYFIQAKQNDQTTSIPLGINFSNLVLGNSGGSFGGGTGVIFITNDTVDPSTNPTGGGILYVAAGALKYRGSSGTVTTLGAA